jgi:N-acetyl-gamma-glutamylphosphate reductase
MVDADNDRTVLIDASTAFRVDDEWTYGFPGEYYPFVSQVDDVVILFHDIIHRMELQDFYL